MQDAQSSDAVTKAEHDDAPEPFSDEIARLSDTILACERLCLLSARGLADCAIGDEDEPVTFIPGVSQNLLNKPEQREHRTTSAQCIAALQSLLPVMGRFQLGTHESKGLAFHPIERGSAADFKLKPLSARVRDIIERGLLKLGASPNPSPPGSAQPTFHGHPFRAALILRATTPSTEIFSDAWWQSLFIVVWYLHQRSGHRRAMPNIHATASPGTAFLTSRCVDAIETVQTVFTRRHDRFERLIEMLHELGEVREEAKWLGKPNTKKVIPGLESQEDKEPVVHAGYRYRTAVTIPEVRACLEELACDSALSQFYEQWLKVLNSKNTKTPENEKKGKVPEKNFKSAEIFLSEVIGGYTLSSRNKKASDKARETKKKMNRITTSIDRRVAGIETIHGKMINSKRRTGNANLKAVPAWVCSADYRKATEAVLQGGKNSRDLLAAHWARHRDAACNARKTVNAFKTYLESVLKDLDDLSVGGKLTAAQINPFLKKSKKATRHLPAIRRQLLEDLEAGARWAEIVLNRQLAYAASGAIAQFDPSELAHALKVVCRDRGRVSFAIILKALHAICAAQRVDGTWNCEQPFHWTESGASMSPMSIEIASAIVSAVRKLVMNPEHYGASQVEVATGLRPVNAALDRFFRWLSGSIQSFPLPAGLRDDAVDAASGRTEPMLYGWCSDRVPESGRIHSWATAAAIDFLVDFRRLLQEGINLLLRVEFTSHHPSELTRLSKVDPTDLGKIVKRKKDEGPLIKRLLTLLREHKKLERAEEYWWPKKPPAADISFWSGLFYGPPGTSKTLLAQAMAAELNWPLISVSPSDFLAKGNDRIEARAQEIFSAFSAASRVVLFFDEIDELIRDRAGEKEEQRTALSFLTPSFLTKLQDLRGAAKKNEFIFVLATNYKDRIDSAAIRSGRIDLQMCVVYPDESARANLLLGELGKMKGKEKTKGREEKRGDFINKYLARVKTNLDKTKIHGDSRKGDSIREFSEDVVRFFAAYTGFLSYQRIQEIVKVFLASRSSEEGKKRLDDLTKEQDRISDLFDTLCDINGRGSPRFKPEINLREYARRPHALDEIKELVSLIPDRRLTEGAENDYDTQRAKQIRGLSEAVDGSFKDSIETLYRASRVAQKQSDHIDDDGRVASKQKRRAPGTRRKPKIILRAN